MSLSQIKKEILAKIVPKQDYSTHIQLFQDSLLESAKKLKILCKTACGGSMAKNTHLEGDADCDIFVRFDYSYKEKDLSAFLEKILLKAGYKPERVHGSRDYFIVKDKITFEVVPVLYIEKPHLAKNVTDMSPLHVQWVRSRTNETLCNEIRLVKAFCKAQRVYGAESYIGGFSGHIIDILTIEYGGFLELLKAASTWQSPLVLDPMHFYKNQNILKSMNHSKIQSPLILVDPLLPERNAAAALTQEKFDMFIVAAKQFVAKPSASFFTKKTITIPNAFILELKPVSGKKDVVGSKLVQVYDYLFTQLTKREFGVTKSAWDWNDSFIIYMKPKKKTLPKTMTVSGPPIHMEQACLAFRKEHKKVFTKAKRLYATEKREFIDALSFVKVLLKTPYVTERISSFKLVSK